MKTARFKKCTMIKGCFAYIPSSNGQEAWHFNLAGARKVLPFVMKRRRKKWSGRRGVGQGLEMTMIDPKSGVTIGCQTIPWNDIKDFAKFIKNHKPHP